MNYLNIIIDIFNEHEISKYSELKIRKLNKTKSYPISEGIQFESNDFAGEIFCYSGDEMEYCEMEFLIYFGEKYKAKVIEKGNPKELEKSIVEFLTDRITELKNVA